MNNTYLCSMKKEFGKWLMDIAKYMVTALLLSTIFAEMNEPIIIYVVVILSAIVLGFGLYWVNMAEQEQEKKTKKIEYNYRCRLNRFDCYCRNHLFKVSRPT